MQLVRLVSKPGLQLLLAAVVFVPQLLSAQAGRVFNPRMSTANPDLVAYERLVDDRQELTIFRLSDTATFSALRAKPAPGVIVFAGMTGGSNVTTYSGDMDWRPVVIDDKDVKHWFAYIASDRGTVKVYLNYIDSRGKLAEKDPLALNFAGSGPRWSPDGKHLAVVSDSGVMHIFWNIDQAMRGGNVAALKPTRVAQAGTGVSSPEWSPKSNYIAYQADRNIRGSRRSQIEVLGVDTATKAIRGSPVVLTEDLGDVRAYRPSWSQDARYIAFYLDHLGRVADGDAGSLDIGVVEAQAQPGTGRILRGELQRGQSSRLAETVMANLTRGPAWTRATIGGTPQAALVYVQRDDAKGNPMYVHSLGAWLASRGRDVERVAIAPAQPSVNNREVSATESNGTVIYTYVSVAQGGEVLNTYKAPNSQWATGPAPMLPGKALAIAVKASRVVRGASLPLAFVFPGAGHFAGDHKLKGLLYSSVGIASAGFLLKGISGTKSAISDGQAAFDSKNLIANQAARKTYDSEKSTATIGAGALGGIWVIALIDAAMHTKTTTGVQVIGPGTAPTSKFNATNVGLKVPFGSSRR